jgi:D-sedoheptulose 7-phosphate isomerase
VVNDDMRADMQALYPFLYSDESRLAAVDAVIEHVRRSTVDKAREIIQLRSLVMENDGDRLMAAAEAMAQRFNTGGRLLAFGNGGSSTDAQDLASLFLSPSPDMPSLPALCLTNDIAVITALCNDVGFEVVFSRQVAAVGLSTSGNSANLLWAFDEAARRGMLTIGICGYDGGRMAELDSIDYLFVVPSSSVHRIQEAQTTIYHALWELTMAALEDVSAEPGGGQSPAGPVTA